MGEPNYNPRAEVVDFIEQSLRRGAETGRRPYNDRLVNEVIKGSDIGKDLYHTMENLYNQQTAEKIR